MTDTGRKSFRRPGFYALLLLAAYLTYQVLGPFIAALLWAAMFAIIFRRMYVALTAKMGPNRAALVTTLIAGFAIVAPVVMLVTAAVREAPQATSYLQQTSVSAPHQIERIWDVIRSKSPVALPEDPIKLITEGARRAITALTSHAGDIVGNVLATLGTLAAMLFALFFMLRDGETMRRKLRDLLPLPEKDSDRLMNETRDLVIASVGAGAAVAAAQGTIGGVAFWLLGLGDPLFWGVAIAFCSLLPVVGATIVWVPAGLGLLLSGEIGRGVIMLVVGVVGISGIDNVLRPALMSGKTSVSGMVIFFGLLGGAAAFGLVGLIIGPIILVITGSLFEMLSRPDVASEAMNEAALPPDRVAAAGRL